MREHQTIIALLTVAVIAFTLIANVFLNHLMFSNLIPFGLWGHGVSLAIRLVTIVFNVQCVALNVWGIAESVLQQDVQKLPPQTT